ncbi:MAG TPA: S9 family peptidase [Pirellulales bacterium]|nr:S9 family peptidase [Pirellulales bacterium]
MNFHILTLFSPAGVGLATCCLVLGCNPAARDAAQKPKQQPAAEEIAPAVEAEPAAPAETPSPQPRRRPDEEPIDETPKTEEQNAHEEIKPEAKVNNDLPDTPLIPRKVLFGNPDRAAAKISPDGRRLAFLAPVEGVLNVWVGPLDKPDSARAVTHDKLRGIRTYHWAYTNDHIIYLQDVGGDENWHVYLVDLATSQATDLTPLGEVNAQITGMSHRLPGEIIVSLNDRNPSVHDLYRIDLESRRRELLEKNTENFTGYVLDDDLGVRFASRMLPDGGSELLRKEGERWSQFVNVPREDTLTTQAVGFDKSGDVLYFIDSRRRNTGALTAWDLTSGQQTLLAENEHADIGEVLAHPTENTIEAVSFNYLRKEWQPLAEETKADLDYLRSVTDGEITIGSQSLDNRRWIVAFLLDDGPVKYFLYDRPQKKATFLFNNRDDLAGRPLAKMQPVLIKARDRLELVSYLTLPPWERDGDGLSVGNALRGVPPAEGIGNALRGVPPAARPRRPLPMVLDVHGGPWARDEWGFNPLHQWLANRGYAVLSVNFRGSTGLGKEFTNAGNREWAGKMHDDLIDAVEWAVRQQIADRDRIAIMGGSYGGYATLVGLTFTPETFACGIDIVGPSNIRTLLSSIPPYWQPMVQMFKDRVGDFSTREGQALLESRSPLTHVARIARPLLIGQGANDPRVKQAESDQIVRLMQTKQIPVTYVLYPDEGHGFARPENRLSFNAVAEAFLAEHLGGRFEPIGDDFSGASITVPAGAEGVPGLAEALRGREAEKE